MNLEDLDDGYIEQLVPEDKESFEELFEKKVKELDIEDIKALIKGHLDDRREHDKIVSAVASGFHQDSFAEGSSESNYEFAFTEPLEELNVSNGDVLLVKEEHDCVYLAIIECKAGSTYSSWIDHIFDIRDVLEQEKYSKELKSQFDASEKEIANIEYVIATKAPNAASIDLDNMGKDVPDNLVIWGYDESESRLFNSSVNKCQDSDLRSTMSDLGIDYGIIDAPIEYTYSTDTIFQLEHTLFEIIKEKHLSGDEYVKEFDRDEIYEKFEGRLQMGVSGSDREELVKSRVEDIISLGKKIGIITEDSDRIGSGRDYRFIFQGKTPQTGQRAVREKYIDFRSEVKLHERAYEIVKEDFEPTQKQEGLESFS